MFKKYTIAFTLLFAIPAANLYCKTPLLPILSEKKPGGTLFLKGKIAGKRIVEYWKKAIKNGETQLPFDPGQEQDIYDVTQILETTDPKTPAHKNAFKAFISYFEGLASAMSAFQIDAFISENQFGDDVKSALEKGKFCLLSICEAVTSADTYANSIHQLTKVLSETMEPTIEAIEENVEKSHFLEELPAQEVLESNKYYKEGTKAGKALVDTFELQGQNKEVPFETFAAAVTLEPSKELATDLAKPIDSPEYQKAFANYRYFLLGQRNVLEKTDVNTFIVPGVTTERNAKKIMFGRQITIDGLTSIVESPDMQTALKAAMRFFLNVMNGIDPMY